MNNPKFECQSDSRDYLELVPGDYRLAVAFGDNGRNAGRVSLSKPQIIELIAQLQSFVDTSDWIKPKKKYVVIDDFAPKIGTWVWITDDPQSVRPGISVYELKEENKIK